MDKYSTIKGFGDEISDVSSSTYKESPMRLVPIAYKTWAQSSFRLSFWKLSLIRLGYSPFCFYSLQFPRSIHCCLWPWEMENAMYPPRHRKRVTLNMIDHLQLFHILSTFSAVVRCDLFPLRIRLEVRVLRVYRIDTRRSLWKLSIQFPRSIHCSQWPNITVVRSYLYSTSNRFGFRQSRPEGFF